MGGFEVRLTPWALYAFPVGVLSAATAIRKLLHERGHGHVGHIVAFNLVTRKGRLRVRDGRVRIPFWLNKLGVAG